MGRETETGFRAPPKSFAGMLRYIGPGLITAGAVVGSGELIATTKTGAQAGMFLLWLIIIGCLVKVFAQVELGRYAISSAKGTMAALNEIPGPRFGANWVLWCWLVMFLVGLAQLGGVVHGVGQSLAMAFPISGDYNALLEAQAQWDLQGATERSATRPTAKTWDDISWAGVVTLFTIGLLANGRYRLVQLGSAAMVVLFTLLTIFCVVALQLKPEWAITAADIKTGLSFRLPPVIEGITSSPMTTALAAFGIIGIGANELIAYPIWVVESGYARFVGERSSSLWATRAKAWIRVMNWDAFLSLILYTLSTVAFYILGAAVLYRQGLDPDGSEMIRVLSQMYVPVFGPWAEQMFLVGAFVVLYSTFFAASASHARVATDALREFRFVGQSDDARRRSVRRLCVVIPLIALVAMFFARQPVALILAGGIAQALMLPVLGFAALYFRFKKLDAELRPGAIWTALLVLSALAFLVTGLWVLFDQLQKVV